MTGKTLLVLCLLWSKAASQVTTATGPRLLPDHKGMKYDSTFHRFNTSTALQQAKINLDFICTCRLCLEKKQGGDLQNVGI